MHFENMRKYNISKTVRDGLCLGCGVCEDICPKHCITIEKGRQNVPQVNEADCIECGLCRQACAGVGIALKGKARELFADREAIENGYLGRYLHCYSGYSTTYDIRYHCASGGCLSQFLIWLLEKGHIDGAVVTKYKNDAPMTPQPFIARNRDEVLRGKSSKYCVVSYEGIITEIKKTPGRYVVVGLPCHIQAFRKAAEVNRAVRERVTGYFPIFCSSNKTMDSQRYMVWRYGVDEKRLASFAYRDEGCLGSTFFRDENGQPIVKPVDFLDLYKGLKAFFSVPRCSVCPDFFGELGDVGFGDLNVGDDMDDPVGINSIITRSREWENLLLQCREEGYLTLDEISEQKMIDAQEYCKKKKGISLYANMKYRMLWGG